MEIRLNLIFLVTVMSCFAGVSMAQEDRGKKLAMAYLGSRAEVWGGEVEVTYRRWFPDHEFSGSWNVAFDGTQHSRRFNHHRNDESIWNVNNGEFQYVYKEGSRTVQKGSSDSQMYERGDEPLDLQCIGVANSGEWDRRLSLESLQDFLLNPEHQITAGEVDGNGHVTIKWLGKIDPNSGARWTREIVIDSSRSFLPIAMVEGMSRATDSVAESRDRVSPSPSVLTVEHAATYEWAKHDGVWLPKVWRYEEFSGRQGAEYTFEWESVNKPLNRELFSLESLELPAGTHIINGVTTPSFVEEIIGGMPVGDDSTSKPLSVTGTSAWLVTINVCFILALAILIAYKRFFRGSREK